MISYTKEELDKIIEKLPKPVQDALFSEDIEARVIELAHIHKLHLDQTEYLDAAVNNVLLGALPASEFIDELVEYAEIPRPSAEAIANDVNEKIFQPLQEHLREITSGQPTPAPVVPPGPPLTPMRDEVLQTISDPSSRPSPSRTLSGSVPNVVQTMPNTVTEAKLVGSTTTAPSNTTIALGTTPPSAPPASSRIGADPYLESIK